MARGEIIKVYLLFILNLDYIKAYMREVKSSQNQGLDDFCSDNQSASKQLNTLQIKHFLKYCVGSILERAAFNVRHVLFIRGCIEPHDKTTSATKKSGIIIIKHR